MFRCLFYCLAVRGSGGKCVGGAWYGSASMRPAASSTNDLDWQSCGLPTRNRLGDPASLRHESFLFHDFDVVLGFGQEFVNQDSHQQDRK